MLKLLRSFLKNSWLPPIAQNFIGTFLGILITFGTSAYLDEQKREDIANRLLSRAADCIDDYAEQMEVNCSNLLQTDSVFLRVNKCYPAHLDALGEDTLKLFILGFYNIGIKQPDKSVEGVFANNIEVMRSVDLELQVDIASYFSAYDYFMTYMKELLKEQNEVYQRCMSHKYIGNCSRYEQTVILLECPEVRNYLIKYHKSLRILVLLKDLFKEECKSLRQTTGLKKEDPTVI